jgi:carboxymethylenebutenolidase
MTKISSETISIATPDGPYDAYLARPEGPAVGAVVVIQEIFGVNANIRDISDWLAGEGYLALAPDLFWRIEPNVSLTDQTEEEWQKAFALMNAFDGDLGAKDIQAAIDHIRNDAQCNGKVGTVGFCLGGRMAYLSATRTNADANVGYYGVGIQDILAEAENISAPLMLHIAGLDEFVPPEAQAAIHAGLDAHPHVALHDYAEQDHAFAREGGAHHDAAATKAAHGRTLALFAEALSR